MTRIARLGLTVCALFGFSAGAPSESQAGVIPWLYDAIFGPVGSIRANNAYYRGGYPAYAGYAPMTVAYAPASYGSYGASGSGCACNQSTSYYPAVGSTSFYSDAYSYNGPSGCSSCGNSGYSSCASGNCSAGYGSTPVTSGYGPTNVPAPTPDPNLNGRNSTNYDVNKRLNELEHQLRVLDHRQKEDEKFLDRQYEGKYAPSPYSSSTYSPYSSGTYHNDRGEIVPQRQHKETFQSNDRGSDQMYRPRPKSDPIEEESRKPVLGAPASTDDKSNDKSNEKSNTQSNESEPQAMNLDFRVTSRAVAPIERMQIVTKQSKLQAVAKLNKKPVKTSENQSSTELARH